MFIVSEHTPSGWARTKTNNIRDVYDIVLGITGSEKEASYATIQAGDMGFGGLCIRNRYKIECERE